jgi:hypothetical protein
VAQKVVENFPNNGIKNGIMLIFGVNAIVLTIFLKSRKGHFRSNTFDLVFFTISQALSGRNHDQQG